jgi:HlyD family secretion protein
MLNEKQYIKYFSHFKKNWKKAWPALLLLPLLAFSVSKAETEKPATTATAALTVTAIKPQLADFPQKISANGNIAAWQEAIIGSV